MKRNVTNKVFMLLIQLAAIVATLIFEQVALAQEIPLAASPPATIYYTTSGADPIIEPSTDSSRKAAENERKNKELKNNLLKKYDLNKDTLTIRLDHTPHGPNGYINLMIKRSARFSQESEGMNDNKEKRLARAKSVALAFVENELDLLGITNINDLIILRENSNELGITSIRFQRVIEEIPLENSIIQIDVGVNGKITWINGEILSPPPELFEAAKKETLPEERIREIAEDVLRGVGFDAETDPSIRKHLKAEKIAVSTPPYVLWKVESTWTILIDAFTGEVVKKQSNIRR